MSYDSDDVYNKNEQPWTSASACGMRGDGFLLLRFWIIARFLKIQWSNEISHIPVGNIPAGMILQYSIFVLYYIVIILTRMKRNSEFIYRLLYIS